MTWWCIFTRSKLCMQRSCSWLWFGIPFRPVINGERLGQRKGQRRTTQNLTGFYRFYFSSALVITYRSCWDMGHASFFVQWNRKKRNYFTKTKSLLIHEKLTWFCLWQNQECDFLCPLFRLEESMKAQSNV